MPGVKHVAGHRVQGCGEARILRVTGEVREINWSLPHVPWWRVRARLRIRTWLRQMVDAARPELQAGAGARLHRTDGRGRVLSLPYKPKGV